MCVCTGTISLIDEGYSRFMGALPRLEQLDEDKEKSEKILSESQFTKFVTFRERVFAGVFDAEMSKLLGTGGSPMLPAHSR